MGKYEERGGFVQLGRESDLIAHIKGVCRNATQHNTTQHNGVLSGERRDEKKYLPEQNNEQQHAADSRDWNGTFIKKNSKRKTKNTGDKKWW